MDLQFNEDGLLWDDSIQSKYNVLATLPVEYAKLFATAPGMKLVLTAIANDCESFLNEEMDISPSDLIAAFKSVADKYRD